MSGAVVERSRMGVLPSTSDAGQWDEREQALALQLGLAVMKRNGDVEVADRGTIEAFLAHCERTKLDPIARQIYIIKRGNKWQTQISIDGARLVAERSGDYEGQTPVEWTADGVTWAQVWLGDSPPAAARVGVFRRGFRDALYAVARWDSYAVYSDVWANGRKTGEKELSSMWAKMPDLMLGKVAEMLALRKAFPMDLSGLYSPEEMQQADAGRASAPRAESAAAYRGMGQDGELVEEHAAAAALRSPQAEPDVVDAEVVGEPAADSSPEPAAPVYDQDAWALRIQQCTSVDQLRALWNEAEAEQLLGAPFGDEGHRLGDVLRGFKARLETGR